MKFLAFAALAGFQEIQAQSTVHTSCTKTWKDAADTACTGTGEICFDWLTEDKSTSKGLMCGLSADCNKPFKYNDGTADVMYYAQCDGLSMFDCSTDKTV